MLHARATTSNYVWRVGSLGHLDHTYAYTAFGARPVLNLKSEILHDSGEGIINSPYKVKEGP